MAIGAFKQLEEAKRRKEQEASKLDEWSKSMPY
jgi:hypothetical protein